MPICVACYAFNGLMKFLHGIYLPCVHLSNDTKVFTRPLHWSVDALMCIQCGFKGSSFQCIINLVANLCGADSPLLLAVREAKAASFVC